MRAEQVFQIVVRPRNARGCVAVEQPRPPTLCHLLELLQLLTHGLVLGLARRLTNPPPQSGQPLSHVLGRPLLLVLQRPRDAANPLESRSHRRPQCGGLLQAPPPQRTQAPPPPPP